MRPGRKNGIKPDGWKIELELGNKQDLLEIGKQKQIRKPMDFVLSKNDKTDPPHNTQKIIAESLGMSTGKVAQAELVRAKAPEVWELVKAGEGAMGGGDKKSAAAKSGLSKNDKPLEPPHNTQKIIAESLGMSTGKAKLGGDHGNQYKKVALLSINDKTGNPPHNTREIIASNDQA